jgi:hypothetical protein
VNASLDFSSVSWYKATRISQLIRSVTREQKGTNDMAEAKKGQKPQDPKLAEGRGGQAQEKESSEVGGREKGHLVAYTCWRCGEVNWVNSNWTYFICWNCSFSNLPWD